MSDISAAAYDSPPRKNHKGTGGMDTRTNDRRSVQVAQRKRSSRNDHGDFLKEQAIRRSRAQISACTGLTPRGAENIRLGESKISYDALTEWLQNDPQFRAEYFKYVGGELETDPQFYAHMSRAINAYMRGKT